MDSCKSAARPNASERNWFEGDGIRDDNNAERQLGGLSFYGPGGPPIDMKMRLSCACTLMERGRRRSVYTLDPVRPFLSLIGNARLNQSVSRHPCP
jgi:hypothetical protein